jgi:septum formation protein
MRLVLASQSPSRIQLLKQLVENFEIDPSHLNEDPRHREIPRSYVLRISKEKALVTAKRHPEKYVLGADTIVSVGRRILGKAQTPEHATQQIKLLSGKRHRVYTALTLCLPCGHIQQRLSLTKVRFKVLDDQEIQQFILSEQWKDVSVYRHEGIAGQFILWMQGVPSTLSGLPLSDTYLLLKGHNFFAKNICEKIFAIKQ